MDKTKKYLILGKDKTVQITKKAKQENDQFKHPVALFFQFGDLGLKIALPIVLGAIFGWYLDNKFNTKPTLTLVLIVLGFILSFINFYIFIKQFINKK